MSVFNTDEMDGEEAAFNAAEMDKRQLLSAGCRGTVSRNHGTPVHRSDFFSKNDAVFLSVISRSSLGHRSVKRVVRGGGYNKGINNG